MISKKTRRSTKAVEPLNQFPITAGKGIDVSKPADTLTAVQEVENFDITTSGDLELRKPMLVKQTFSSTDTEKVLKVFPLYDPNYRLVVYINPTNNRTWIRIVDTENNVQPLRYSWTNYFTEEEYTQTITEQTLLAAEKVPFDWSGVQLGSLSTASVCTNVLVDVCSSVFKIDDAVVMHDDSLLPENTNVYREIQISYSPYIPAWVVKIITPLMNTLTDASASDGLPFDANQALDNPYALRDSYNSTIPTVKGALAYVLSDLSTAKTPKPTQGAEIHVTHTSTSTTANPSYTTQPTTLRITTAKVETLKYQQGSSTIFNGTIACSVTGNVTNKTLANAQIRVAVKELATVPVVTVEYDLNNQISLLYCVSYTVNLTDFSTEATSLSFDNYGKLKTITLPVVIRNEGSFAIEADGSILDTLNYNVNSVSASVPLPAHLNPEPPVIQSMVNFVLRGRYDNWIPTGTTSIGGSSNAYTIDNGYFTTTLDRRKGRCLHASSGSTVSNKHPEVDANNLNQTYSVNYSTGALPDSVLYKTYNNGSMYEYIYYMLPDECSITLPKFQVQPRCYTRSGVDSSTQILDITTDYYAERDWEHYYLNILSTDSDESDYWRVF